MSNSTSVVSGLRSARWPSLIAAVLAVAAPTLAAPHAKGKAKVAQTPAAPQIVIDNSQVDAIHTFGVKAQAVATEWYPKIVAILGAEKSTPPQQVNIVMDMDYDGVAATGGTGIHVSTKYVHAHPTDYGMIVHELTHVVQKYPKYDPVWLVEGIADYVRFYYFEPASNRPHPNPAKATYHDSYRTTAAFLDWASNKYDKSLVKKLDAALKAGTYTEEVFHQATGKTLDQLGTEWLASLKS